jgi:hypothetical protein
MKYEIKIHFQNNDKLKSVIEKSYFEDGTLGKLVGKKSFLKIERGDSLYNTLRGLDKMFVKISNEDMIDGSMRLSIDESEIDFIKLIPINNYCIVEKEKYCFY